MSRSGYSDDCSGWSLIRWRGQVASSIRGARGQAMLRELLAALDAMPEKSLAAESLVNADGEYCTLGVLGAARGLDMATIDPEDSEAVAKAFGIAVPLVREIVWMNDENSVYPWTWIYVDVCGPLRPWDSPTRRVMVDMPRQGENRWHVMREWVAKQIKQPAAAAA